MTSAFATRERRERHYRRYREVAMVLLRHRLNDMLGTFGLDRFLPFHWIPPELPWVKSDLTKPQRTRIALEDLGTTFVKVGQILSTRTDILPSDYTNELAGLQNGLRPLPTSVVEDVIAGELGHSVSEIFRSFDATPVGVASIGQAHAAVLKDGTEVVVKARKPGVLEQVEEDLDILRQLAASAADRWEGAEHYDLPEIVEEIAETLTHEMDYIREGHNADHFAQFFGDDSSIHIPKIFWDYTTPRVIVLERIKGISIRDVAALDKAGFDIRDLARRATGLWVRMVFRDVVFHADPHPGNIFVEADGRLGLIDFGMAGFVDDDVRERLANAVRGMLERDADLVVDSLIDLGAASRSISDREGLRRGVKHVMSHYAVPSMETTTSNTLTELLNTARRNHVRMPANTFLLLKTMGMAQALGKGLDPDFDFFALLRPEVQAIIDKRFSAYSVITKLPSAAAELAALGASLPKRVNRLMSTIEHGDFRIRTDVDGLETHLEHLERIVKRLVIGMVIGSLVIGASLIAMAYFLRP